AALRSRFRRARLQHLGHHRTHLEHDGAVRGDDVAVVGSGLFWGSALGRVVDVDQAKAMLVAVRPFEVIDAGPVEIALDGEPLAGGAGKLSQVASDEIDPRSVVHTAVQAGL